METNKRAMSYVFLGKSCGHGSMEMRILMISVNEMEKEEEERLVCEPLS